jgi:UDP-glucuronate decarboxylase
MDIDDGRVITNIINQVIHNRPITIYGDGEQTRSFCYIDDMLDGLVALMDSREAGPINLGNPDTECTMNELVLAFEKMFGYKLMVANIPKMENDPLVRKPDISSAKRLLGFSPKVGLEEGLHRTFKYFCEIFPPEIMGM